MNPYQEQISNMVWLIYMYTFPNMKRYIGQTYRTLENRQGPGFREYKRQPVLYAAIQKYGINNIQQDILFDNIPTQEEANRLESICILLFKTNCAKFRNPSYGYNLTDGGASCKNYGNKVICLENGTTYINASTASIRLFGHSGYTSKINACCRGVIYQTHGLHFMSADDYTKDAANARLNHQRAKSRRSRSVYCIEVDQYFETATEAARYLGDTFGVHTSSSHIMRNCRKQESTSGGYHFLFAEDVNEDNIIRALLKPPTRHRAVRCVETGAVYQRVIDAAKDYGIKRNSSISACCKHQRQTAGGYHWEYAEVI